MRNRVIVGVAATLSIVVGTALAWFILATLMLGKITGVTVSPSLNWWTLANAWFGKQNPWASAMIVASAIAPTILCGVSLAIGFVVLRRQHRLKHLRPADQGGLRAQERGVTDNHGHARFATKEEIRKRFPGKGCLIGATHRSADTRDMFYADPNDGPGHSLIFAGPGSHKSMSSVSRIFKWSGPCVVFDPSAELGAIMGDALEARGRKVVKIEENGGGVNVLDWIDIRKPQADAHIKSVVEWIYNEGEGAKDTGRNSAMWGIRGREMVTCVLADVLHHPDPLLPKNLKTVREFLSRPERDLPVMFEQIHEKSHSALARDLAGTLMGMAAKETFSGINANCSAATSWLGSDLFANIVSGNAMKTQDVLDPDIVTFVQIPLRTLLSTPSVARAVMGSLFNAMFEADGIDGLDRILFQIDEAKTLGPMKEIALCYATARKYLGCISTIWQSEGQLEEVWGREGARTLRDMSAWRSYNAVQDGDIAEKLSRDLGEHGVLSYSEGHNSGLSKQSFSLGLGNRSTGSNVNVHEQRRRLIKADEIMRADADEMFVFARDFACPIRCRTAPYFRYPDIDSVMKSNRFNRSVA